MHIRKTLLSTTIALLLCAELPAPVMAAPATAAPVGNAVWFAPSASERPVMTDVQVRRRTTVRRGPGGRVVRRSTVVRPGYGRGYGRRGWVRPGYRWGPGGAIAAGAALGFVGAATAAAWAGSAPAPGMCWYYTNSSRRSGFWDYCP
jgi:hypothetical protein